MSAKIVCFGELLVRLSAPGHEKLLQSPSLNVAVGGAEANVAVSLARFGHEAKFVSVVGDNELGQAAIGTLAYHRVDVSGIVKAAGRMGLYFLSRGAVTRPSQVLYDRAGSSFASAAPNTINWDKQLSGADWLHVSGISPAVSATAAQATLFAVKAAGKLGIKVSFDGNYRAQLWAAWEGDGPTILREIISHADHAFINERDISLILDSAYTDRATACAAAFRAFPRLMTIAATSRDASSVTSQTLSAEFVSRSQSWSSRVHKLEGIIDRIGGGDAFAAGVLHGLVSGSSPQNLIDFAIAASAIKHSIPGDFNLTTIGEVEAAMSATNLDVKR
jgi:2-dehydro-3-deoxygluconokinase